MKPTPHSKTATYTQTLTFLYFPSNITSYESNANECVILMNAEHHKHEVPFTA